MATLEVHTKLRAPGEPYEGPHIGLRLAKKLDTHRWHALRIRFANPQLETYEAMVSAKTMEPKTVKELLGKVWCARQIMWPNQQSGILVETGGNGYYLVTPGAVQL